jgi:uncharacterized FAD-dependent dehydrogenase
LSARGEITVYDVIIVGGGPSGIFSAIALVESGVDNIVILEQGKDIEERERGGDSLLHGWGGAGAFSDGKLTLSTEVGGILLEYFSEGELLDLLSEVDEKYLEYGAPDTIHGDDPMAMRDLEEKAKKVGLRLVKMTVRHMGTERCLEVLKRFRDDLDGKVEIRVETPVQEILSSNGTVEGVRLKDGQELKAKAVVLAPGRSGSAWVREEAKRIGISTIPSPIDLGVRVEVPAAVFKSITDVTYESKLIYYSHSFDDKVRTFCMNPFGEVVTEVLDDVVTVNGHSYADRKTENTNFAILVSTTFTRPFDNPISYGRYIARLANFLGKGVIIQRLGDLMSGRRSTSQRITRSIVQPTLREATAGDLSFVLPYRYLKDIMEMLEALDHLAPGVYSRHTLLYGVEVKFYSNRLRLTRGFETEISGLYAVGDGAGVTRGLLQASSSGLVAGREIAGRLKG